MEKLLANLEKQSPIYENKIIIIIIIIIIITMKNETKSRKRIKTPKKIKKQNAWNNSDLQAHLFFLLDMVSLKDKDNETQKASKETQKEEKENTKEEKENTKNNMFFEQWKNNTNIFYCF